MFDTLAVDEKIENWQSGKFVYAVGTVIVSNAPVVVDVPVVRLIVPLTGVHT